MSAKEELQRLVDELNDIDAAEVLAHVQRLLSDRETLSDDALDQVRRGEEQIARGDYVTLDRLRHPVPT